MSGASSMARPCRISKPAEMPGSSVSQLSAAGGGPAERKCAYAALRPFALRMSLPPLNSSRRPFTTGGSDGGVDIVRAREGGARGGLERARGRRGRPLRPGARRHARGVDSRGATEQRGGRRARENFFLSARRVPAPRRLVASRCNIRPGATSSRAVVRGGVTGDVVRACRRRCVLS